MRINLIDNAPIVKNNEFLKANEKETLNPKIAQKLKDAENVAKEFETIYLDMMIKSMRQTAKPEDESNAQDIFKSMLDGEYSKLMANSQNFGIRDLILNWMKESDPDLNPNVKVMKYENKLDASGKKDLKNAQDTISKMKNDSYMSKMAIEQFKIEMAK
ncbi:rod-binding protein [Silvanigrella aquatica]|uniref:Flagellar protein FlgJ N-terminal domain-containing protein n=1 Tax=Silvanigrella aquatica TaxID=1915309 RepID=A0A1L4D2X8_9BACT|nr:rod-binding protein [Silvanigrella aquatica]APJ04544.1 hypothetical protein AXG55_11765 [Silvanigrella aquatica]